MEAQAAAVAGRVELVRWKPTKYAALRVNIYAIVLFLAGSWFVRTLYQRVHAHPLVLPVVRSTWATVCSIVPLAIAAHEAVHVLMVKVHGGHPRVLLGMEEGLLPGAYIVMNEPMAKLGFLHMVLAPSLYLTGLCLAVIVIWPTAAPWFVLAAIVNISGSAGDVELALAAGSYGRNTFFVDAGDGVCVLGELADYPGILDIHKEDAVPVVTASRVADARLRVLRRGPLQGCRTVLVFQDQLGRRFWNTG